MLLKAWRIELHYGYLFRKNLLFCLNQNNKNIKNSCQKLFQFDWWAPKSLPSFRNMTTIFQRDRKLQKKNFFCTPRIIKFVKSPELLYWTKFANWCVKKLGRKKYFNSGPMKGNQGSLVPLHFTVMWRVRETMSYVSGTKLPTMFVLLGSWCLTSITQTCRNKPLDLNSKLSSFLHSIELIILGAKNLREKVKVVLVEYVSIQQQRRRRRHSQRRRWARNTIYQ